MHTVSTRVVLTFSLIYRHWHQRYCTRWSILLESSLRVLHLSCLCQALYGCHGDLFSRTAFRIVSSSVIRKYFMFMLLQLSDSESASSVVSQPATASQEPASLLVSQPEFVSATSSSDYLSANQCSICPPGSKSVCHSMSQPASLSSINPVLSQWAISQATIQSDPKTSDKEGC